MSEARLRRRFLLLVGAVTAILTAGAPSLSAAAGPPGRLALEQRTAQLRHSSPARPAAPSYVVLGDSFTSGEGSGSYLRGTDTEHDRCHRSRLAYPVLLADRSPRLQRLSFVACSGALTRDLYSANHLSGERRQLAALGRRTRTVSLTIGGNDAGFSRVIAGCVSVGSVRPLSCTTSRHANTVLRARLAALAGLGRARAPGRHRIVPILRVLTDISRRAPQARVYLAGYPELFGDQRADFALRPKARGGASCTLNAKVRVRVDYRDAQWINRGTRQLNRVLRDAVHRARQRGVRAVYVSPSPFNHHGLCDRGAPWILPLKLHLALPGRDSLHPTATGQRRGYAVAFRRAGL